ncbi:MAG: radical SAM protein [Spirochaetales bacterium]|nr:radical SAM protein [Spirochaetales bacterium]
MKKIASWNLLNACNYACSYCVQGKKHEGFPRESTVSAIRDCFTKLGAGWEVKFSGGEPFFYPGFVSLAALMGKAGLRISVVTNFSFDFSLYERYVRDLNDNSGTVSISFHEEFVAWHDFLNKAVKLKKSMQPFTRGSLVVNTVVRPGKVEQLFAFRDECASAGIKFYPQLFKVKGKVIGYSAEDTRNIRRLIPDFHNPSAANTGFNPMGKTCYAGVTYFIVTQEGECYTCYPGKRYLTGALGSIPSGTFALKDEPLVCPYDACPCTVPTGRGVVI